MSLKASETKNKGGGGGFEPVESGAYPARVVSVVDLGMQNQRPYNGKDKPPAQEIMFTYELVDEFLKDEDGQDDPSKPRWFSERMPIYDLTSELAKSTLRYHAIDPDGRFGGDFSKLVNSPVTVTIVKEPGRDGKVRNKIAGVSPMRPSEAARCPELVNKAVTFDLDEPDMEAYNLLNKWVQTIICDNLEFRGSRLEQLLGGSVEKGPDAPVDAPVDLDDEIPF